MYEPKVNQGRQMFLTSSLTQQGLLDLLREFGDVGATGPGAKVETVAFNATLADVTPGTTQPKATGLVIMVAPTYEEWG